MNDASYQRLYVTPFAKVYPMYVEKAVKKGRTKEEVDEVIRWLTGFSQEQLVAHLEAGTNFRDFFTQASINPNSSKITGVVCGVRVETMTDAQAQQIRWLDKLVDELAKGKVMAKVLRA